MTRIEKVWEHQRIENGRTVIRYTVFYGKSIKDIPEGKLPMTVLSFILSDNVKAEVTKRFNNGIKRTEYTPA
jgi:hypothetical protein